MVLAIGALTEYEHASNPFSQINNQRLLSSIFVTVL